MRVVHGDLNFRLSAYLFAGWRDEERVSRINDDLILNAEPVFPEFEFDALSFGYAVEAECGEGFVAFGEGQVVCVPCLPGSHYEPLNGTCVLCPVGSYQDRMARLRCEPCPDHLPTANPGEHL